MPTNYGWNNSAQSTLARMHFSPSMQEMFFPGQREVPWGMSAASAAQVRLLSEQRSRAQKAQLENNPAIMGMAQSFAQDVFGMDKVAARNLLYTKRGGTTMMGQMISQFTNAMMPNLGDPAGRAQIAGEMSPFFSGARFGGFTGGIRGAGAGLTENEANRLTDFFMPSTSGRFTGGGINTRFSSTEAFDVMRLGVGQGLMTDLSRGTGPAQGGEGSKDSQFIQGGKKRIKDFVELMDVSSGLLEGFTKEDTFKKIMQLTQGQVATKDKAGMEKAVRDIRALADTADVSVEAMIEIAGRGTQLARQLGFTGKSAPMFGQAMAGIQVAVSPVTGQGLFTSDQQASMGGAAAVTQEVQNKFAEYATSDEGRVAGLAADFLKKGGTLAGFSREEILSGGLGRGEMRKVRRELRDSMGRDFFDTRLKAEGQNLYMQAKDEEGFAAITKSATASAMQEARRGMSSGRRAQLDKALAGGDTETAMMLVRRVMQSKYEDPVQAERRAQMALADRDPEAFKRMEAQQKDIAGIRLREEIAEGQLTSKTFTERLSEMGKLTPGNTIEALTATLFGDTSIKDVNLKDPKMRQLALETVLGSKIGGEDIGKLTSALGTKSDEATRGSVVDYLSGKMTTANKHYDILQRALGTRDSIRTSAPARMKAAQEKADRVTADFQESHKKAFGETLFRAMEWGSGEEGGLKLDIEAEEQLALFKQLGIESSDQNDPERQARLTKLLEGVKKGGAGAFDALKELSGGTEYTVKETERILAAARDETVLGGKKFEEEVRGGGDSSDPMKAMKAFEAEYKAAQESDTRARMTLFEKLESIIGSLNILTGKTEAPDIEQTVEKSKTGAAGDPSDKEGTE